jgi:hypothetical protein
VIDRGDQGRRSAARLKLASMNERERERERSCFQHCAIYTHTGARVTRKDKMLPAKQQTRKCQFDHVLAG